MREDVSGILVVDKEKGMTSHDVVDYVRRKFRIKKVGHAGTLDPAATGVLVILLGKATKLSGKFLSMDKEYTAVMKLGEETDTGDADGVIVNSSAVLVTPDNVRGAMKGFVGTIKQTPPMYSAKKVKGVPLYKLARKGMDVERPPVDVEIKELEAIRTDLPLVAFRVVCSKGTYIRQLASDIGRKLGCGAHLVELRRTRSGDITLESAVSFSEIKKMDNADIDENITRLQG